MMLLLATPGALAWTCNCTIPQVCPTPPGTSLTYHFEGITFNPSSAAAARSEVSAGIEAWNSGPGEPLEDATWAFNQGPDVTIMNLNDNVFTIAKRSGNWTGGGTLWSNATAASFVSPCIWNPNVAPDMVFNTRFDHFPMLTSDLEEANCDGDNTGPYAYGGTAMHEAGHILGLDHVLGYVGAMSTSQIADTSGRWRIQEDESTYMVAKKGNGGSHRNYMLSRFISDGPSFSQDTDNWKDECDLQTILQVSPGGTSPFDGKLTASITGNVGGGSVRVEWAWRPLKATWTCRNPPNSAVAAVRNPGMGVNLPYEIEPWSTLKVPTLPGQYRLCATIDPDDVYPETENITDNVIFSENIVLVQ